MKRSILAFLLLFPLLLATLTACQKDEQDTAQSITYDDATLSEYISPFVYTGRTVELPAGALKSETVWATILESVEIKAYPEGAVEYYAEGRRDTYRYYAEKNDWSYEETLTFFGASEESIVAEARELVKGDLAYRYVVKDAGISLSESEKSAQLDRYVKKIAADYGYTEDYVAENLTDLVYETMLYDKTMEYLIVNNTFVQK